MLIFMSETPGDPNSEEQKIHITDQDSDWLAQYGACSNADRMTIERLADLDGQDLENADEAERIEIVNVRERFFSTLGVSQEHLDVLRAKSPTLTPVATFIKSQRYLDALGLNPARIVRINAEVLALSPESIQSQLEMLSHVGLDALKIVNVLPAAFSLNPHVAKMTLADIAPATTGTKRRNPPTSKKATDKSSAVALGASASKLFNNPEISIYSPGAIEAMIGMLSLLELDAIKILEDCPGILSLPPASIEKKIDDIRKLGLDPKKILKTNASALGYSIQVLESKVAGINSLGLNATKIATRHPNTLSYAIESIKDKLDNLTALGLKATAIINNSPEILSRSPRSIRERVSLIRKICNTLQWEHPPEALIENSPSILSYSNQKLLILARIAAAKLLETERAVPPHKVKSLLIIPLEKYIITLAGGGNKSYTASELLRARKQVKLNQGERRAQALISAPNVGKIGLSYLKYRGVR